LFKKHRHARKPTTTTPTIHKHMASFPCMGTRPAPAAAPRRGAPVVIGTTASGQTWDSPFVDHTCTWGSNMLAVSRTARCAAQDCICAATDTPNQTQHTIHEPSWALGASQIKPNQIKSNQSKQRCWTRGVVVSGNSFVRSQTCATRGITQEPGSWYSP
jgi:hypothetical protein